MIFYCQYSINLFKTYVREIYEQTPVTGIIWLVQTFKKSKHIPKMNITHHLIRNTHFIKLVTSFMVKRYSGTWSKRLGLTFECNRSLIRSFNILCELKRSSFNSHSSGSLLFWLDAGCSIAVSMSSGFSVFEQPSNDG